MDLSLSAILMGEIIISYKTIRYIISKLIFKVTTE